MNQTERMYAANAGNCAKGGRDPRAQRSSKASLGNHKPRKEKTKKFRKKKEKVKGTSEASFLQLLVLAKKAGRVTQEQYRELRDLVKDGDDIDLDEAVALRKAFANGTCTTTREERDAKRSERTKEKIFEKIAVLQVRQWKEDEILWKKIENSNLRKRMTNEQRKSEAKEVMKRKQLALAAMKQEHQRICRARQEQHLLLSVAAYEGKYSKAIPSTFHAKALAADDKRQRANVHHAGSHYHMAGTKAQLKGDRVPGIVSRHSKQAAIRNGKALRGD